MAVTLSPTIPTTRSYRDVPVASGPRPMGFCVSYDKPAVKDKPCEPPSCDDLLHLDSGRILSMAQTLRNILIYALEGLVPEPEQPHDVENDRPVTPTAAVRHGTRIPRAQLDD